MRKKIVCAASIITMILMFTGCHRHTWEDATCTEPKTCSECGETEGKALGHTWEEATCTEPKTCSVCGETEGNALGHTGNATCEEEGVCSVCGQTIKALGHTWEDATCTEPKTCSACGKTEGEALGHTTTNGICDRCKEEIVSPQEFSGSGDDVVTNVNLGSSGIYRAHITHSGSRNFIVKSYSDSGSKHLMVNTIGDYDGYVLVSGNSPLSIEVQADGNWNISIEKCGTTTENSFSGSGDYVTDIFQTVSGAWTFTYNGEHNFVVRAYTTSGSDLIVNTIGSYEGTQMLTVPTGSNVVLEITADTSGTWTAAKN